MTQHDTNRCTNTFMHIIRLSNIFIGQKMVILLYILNISIIWKITWWHSKYMSQIVLWHINSCIYICVVNLTFLRWSFYWFCKTFIFPFINQFSLKKSLMIHCISMSQTKLVQISYNHPHQLNELLKNAVNPVDSLSLNILQHQWHSLEDV
jgi:hypothetical protein